jgi:hypothetical protein
MPPGRPQVDPTTAIEAHLAAAAERCCARATQALTDRANPETSLQWLRLQQRLANTKVRAGVPMLGELDDELRMIRRDSQLRQVFEQIDRVLAAFGELLLMHARRDLRGQPEQPRDHPGEDGLPTSGTSFNNLRAGREALDMLSAWHRVSAARRQIHWTLKGRY